MRIVFFGTPEFAVASLRALLRERFTVAGVVTQPDKPAGPLPLHPGTARRQTRRARTRASRCSSRSGRSAIVFLAGLRQARSPTSAWWSRTATSSAAKCSTCRPGA